MDPSFPNFFLNLGNSQEYPNTQYFENSQFFLNPSQVHVTESSQALQNTDKQARTNKWDAAEDVALMSAWCLVSTNRVHGKNQKKTSLWAEVKKLYDETQAENPEKLDRRNEDQMKGRFKRLNQNAQKWVSACREAYRRGRSGMSQKDIESEAHKIYEQDGNKFNDIVVFNEVMCKHPKWALELHHDTTRSRPECELENVESGGSTKRSRTTEEGDYSNPETPNSGGSTIQRPIGRDTTKKKGKGKISSEFFDEIRALRLTRDNEVEVMNKRVELELQKEQKKDERNLKKMQLLHLNTLLKKENLSADEENMKRILIAKFYGN
ncbi:hypothetical protein E3N88_30245 [Mikania micrantha]|uniref:No apical meristem-associated C-terminal domain-containing protein n=1 Tax=Mikania micrantha TaxID=192012 RepID=A0A5N6MLU6_9ASTR|nr:hypothetical protein E3N88_30245 [Mikania micrantha]